MLCFPCTTADTKNSLTKVGSCNFKDNLITFKNAITSIRNAFRNSFCVTNPNLLPTDLYVCPCIFLIKQHYSFKDMMAAAE